MLDILFSGDVFAFSVPAILGTLVFLLKLAAMFAGADGGDADLDVDIDVDAADADGSTDAFRMLSLQAIAAFMMGFGWAGLGARLGFGWELIPSLAVGAAGGIALVWLLGLLLKAMYDLEGSGAVDLRRAVGVAGTVYVTVPGRGEGRGQVRVVIDGRDRTLTAVTEGEAIRSGAAVMITNIDAQRTATVAVV